MKFKKGDTIVSINNPNHTGYITLVSQFGDYLILWDNMKQIRCYDVKIADQKYELSVQSHRNKVISKILSE
jgi:hypothetical protein